ncbi:hypothetical protein [Komagataeibacter sp. FNDCF1]|nr:hypothetical protein [Komagataeibacter sp. FNDCF1]
MKLRAIGIVTQAGVRQILPYRLVHAARVYGYRGGLPAMIL